jgi:3'-phosphoadenosine 5'-phosphosulfate sulfotransferase (PAPS reductase)/FAD synthetase
VAVTDPFLVAGPAVISFSGGRTSGYMLHRIVQAHGGRLPDDVLVCFANTGREMPGTLDFVRDCGEAFGVRVHWLEFRCDPPAAESGKARLWAEEVNHNSASRDGEPFEALLRQRRFLPNPVSRFCTTELKIRTIRRWCVQEFGAKTKWTQVVGLRADEPQRVERILDPARQKKAGRESRNVAVPLAVAGITKADVLAFWSAQPFDLRLRGEWEGNCDGCFLKRKSFIARLWLDHPQRAEWWARVERDLASAKARNPDVGRFRKDWKGGYAAIGEQVSAQGVLPAAADDDDGLDLFAACDLGCGA